MRFSSFAVAGILLAATRPAAAQVTVSGIRDLAFGPVILGVDSHVLPSDAVRSGQFRIVTAIGNTVRLQFSLPNWLDGPSNDRLRISFADGDGIVVESGGNSVPLTFNPRNPQKVDVVNSTTINVFVGGTVSTSATQATGAYTNTITLTVTVL